MIDETVEEIADMQTHSSSEVALKAIDALRVVTTGEYATLDEYVRSLSRNCRALRHADPSHATLFTSTHAVEDAVQTADPPDIEAAKRRTLEAIDEEVDRVRTAKRGAAEAAADLVEAGGTYVTLDFSSTLLAVFETAGLAADDPIVVYTLEARPRYLGRKMARRLADLEGIEPRLVVDNAMGTVLSRCDRALVGMTCIAGETLYNRVGTYPLAATAAHAEVPVHAVGARTKVIDEHFTFEADDRPASEVSAEPLDDISIENPAYDATPVSLLASVVTDDGHLFERVASE